MESLTCPYCQETATPINDPQDKGRNCWGVLCGCGLRGPILPTKDAAIAVFLGLSSAAALLRATNEIEAYLRSNTGPGVWMTSASKERGLLFFKNRVESITAMTDEELGELPSTHATLAEALLFLGSALVGAGEAPTQ